jgi:ribosomal protein S18 acetylase RimI-like enzyme
MAHTLHWLAQRQQRNASIVMDGSNIAAQRLYQKCGFRSHKVELWYHKWFTDEADS